MQEEVQLRIYYPKFGSFDWGAVWDNVAAVDDSTAYLSRRVIIPVGLVPAQTSQEITFDFGDYLKLVPHGARSIAVVKTATGELFSNDPVPKNKPFPVDFVAKSALPALVINWELQAP